MQREIMEVQKEILLLANNIYLCLTVKNSLMTHPFSLIF